MLMVLRVFIVVAGLVCCVGPLLLMFVFSADVGDDVGVLMSLFVVDVGFVVDVVVGVR